MLPGWWWELLLLAVWFELNSNMGFWQPGTIQDSGEKDDVICFTWHSCFRARFGPLLCPFLGLHVHLSGSETVQAALSSHPRLKSSVSVRVNAGNLVANPFGNKKGKLTSAPGRTGGTGCATPSHLSWTVRNGGSGAAVKAFGRRGQPRQEPTVGS